MHRPEAMEEVAVVTGANTGIGFAVAQQLCAEGLTVVCACRDRARGEAACAALRAAAAAASDSGPAPCRCELRLLDLASLASVRRFADDLCAGLGGSRRLRLLVCNGGVNSTSVPHARDQQLTEDGLDRLWQVNFVSHFLLTCLLLPALSLRGGDGDHGGRVLNVSSVMHRHADLARMVDPAF
eukprot:SAG22_NODE_2815_length_2184_cov_2.473861_1_plen_182_part_10